MSVADVAVIGGGIVGLSTAYFLADAGVGRVVVLERDTVGSGATGRAAGGILLQGESEEALRWQLESLALHERFREELGTDLEEHGSLLLWCTPEGAVRARELLPLHRSVGIPVEPLEPEEVRSRFPYVAIDGVVLGTFSPRDPWATPLATVQRLAAAARARGVEIREHCEVVGLEVASGRVQRVLTTRGALPTSTVVNAAGAWARRIGEMVGVQIPVSPRKRQVFVLDPGDSMPPKTPFIMEAERDYYCKRRSEGLLMVCGQTEGETLEAVVEWGYLDLALEPTERRIPGVRGRPIVTAWAGIRPMSPDGRPLLGAVPGVEGFFVAGGFGGQGFARGPLAGRLIADLIVTGRPSLDLRPFRVDRFLGGR